MTKKTDLKVVELAVGGGGDVEAGDVEDDLLAVGGQDPPLALVPLLEQHRVNSRRGAVHCSELWRPKLRCCFLGRLCHLAG